MKGLDQLCSSYDMESSAVVFAIVFAVASASATSECSISGLESLNEASRGRVVHEVGHADHFAVQERHGCVDEVVVLHFVQDLEDSLVLDELEGRLIKDKVELC